jgi:hypothetical protein
MTSTTTATAAMTFGTGLLVQSIATSDEQSTTTTKDTAINGRIG